MHKIGIALSGGGARGIAHLGVLQALHERGLEPEIVSGTSMGAIIGALYAAGNSPRKIFEETREDDRFWDIYALSRPRLGFGSQKLTHKLMDKLIAHNDFAKLKKPFFVSTTNLTTGANEIISKGKNLYEAVLASSSIPVLFRPIRLNGMLYVDGGITNNMPLDVLRPRCRFLIGVHVNYVERKEEIKNIPELADRVFQIAVYNTIRDHLDQCDLYIDPPELRNYGVLNFHEMEKYFQIGYDYTTQLIDSTELKIPKRSFWQKVFLSEKNQSDKMAQNL